MRDDRAKRPRGGRASIAIAAAFLTATAVGLPAQSNAQELAPNAPDVRAQFVGPHERVDIGDGRKLNLFCMGSGTQTVLFDSGLSDWSAIWALVQPGVAKFARACSYDRAGMGYSDPAKEARSPIAIVDDLHNLVHRAGLKTPLVLVGHSLGGFNMKLYAALYPEDVSGLVLVDPSEDRDGDRSRDFLRRRYGPPVAGRLELLSLSGIVDGIAHYEDCAAAARAHDLDPASDFYKHCTDPVRAPLGPEIAAERARLQVGRAYQDTQASELANSVYGDNRADRAYAMLFRPGAFGNKPLIVLTHGIYDRKDPLDAADFAAWNRLHLETARLSRRGVERVVPNTHHNIEIDDPQAIVDAVSEVVAQLRPHVQTRLRARR